MSRQTGTPGRGGGAAGGNPAYPYSNAAPTSSPTASSYAAASPYQQQTPYQYTPAQTPYQAGPYPPADSPPSYYSHPTGSVAYQQATSQYNIPASLPSPPSTGDDPAFTQVPSPEDYNRRVYRHSQEPTQLPRSVPDGWPARIEGPSAWKKEDLLRDQASWFYSFSQSDREVLHYALCNFRDSGMDPLYISPNTFPIADPLGSTLKGIGNRLYHERGIFLVRGLNLDQYDEREMVIMHAGISSYIGSQRAYQCEDYNVVSHIRDLSRLGGTESNPAPSATSNEIGFHTDIGDIISNLTIHPAAEGGTSYFANSTQVYNELATKRPDIIHQLTHQWQFDIFPDVQIDKPSIQRPLLYKSGTYVTLLCFRRPFVATPPYNRRQGNLYPISPAQKEALDTVHYTALNMAFAIRFERGDISFTNNLRVLHARESFRDYPGLPQRHVQRLIVRQPSEVYRLPEGLRDIWQKIYGEGDPSQPKTEAFRPEPTAGDPLWKMNG